MSIEQTILSAAMAGQAAEAAGATVRPSDFPALLMLGLVLVICGAAAALARSFHRREKNPDPASKLLDEVSARESDGCSTASGEGDGTGAVLDPWARPADWWKHDRCRVRGD